MVQGHQVPKGPFVIINFRSVLIDQEYWKYFEVFRPDRFLNENRNFTKDEGVIEYGEVKALFVLCPHKLNVGT